MASSERQRIVELPPAGVQQRCPLALASHSALERFVADHRDL